MAERNDFVRCIRHSANEQVFLVTRTGGSYIKGRWTGGTESREEILASVQPVTGLELQMLPENYRQRATVKVYSPAYTKTGARIRQQEPDSIVWQNRVYEVQSVQDWSERGGYRKIIAVLQREYT